MQVTKQSFVSENESGANGSKRRKKNNRMQSENFKMKGVKCIEEITYEKKVTQVEQSQIQRVFALLCGKGKQGAHQFDFSMSQSQSQIQAQSQSSMTLENDPECWGFGKRDIARVLLALLEQSEPDRTLTKARYLEIKHEVDSIAQNMLWEVDEDLNEEVSYYEFLLMYKRCIYDKSGLEPRNLFYMVQFLMFDKMERKRITIEDTLELLYVICKEYNTGTTLDEEIEYLFGKEEKTVDGQEKDITWAQYESLQKRRNYDMRKKKEDEKKQSSSILTKSKQE